MDAATISRYAPSAQPVQSCFFHPQSEPKEARSVSESGPNPLIGNGYAPLWSFVNGLKEVNLCSRTITAGAG